MPASALSSYKHMFDTCDRNGALMVFICKLFTVEGCDIQGFPAGSRLPLSSPLDRSKQYEIALCRSFSGVITTHSPLFVIPCRSA